MEKIMINDADLDNVTGGKITYTWDGNSGTIGIGGNNCFVLVNKEAFVSYYKSVEGTGMKDSEILTNLIKKGYVKKK